MALAVLAAEAAHAGDRLRRQGFAAVDGSAVDLTAATAAFDALGAATDAPVRIAPDHSLVTRLLEQPALRDLVTAVLGDRPQVTTATAFDQHTPQPVSWHQAWQPTSTAAAPGLVLRWHLDLIGPADGGLRVLPGSHAKGRLSLEAIAALAREVPAVELAVSRGTVLALDPLTVRSSRRRTTRGPRRILQVELAGSR